MKERLMFGTRVRAKARTIAGWKGTGTHLWFGIILKDGSFSKAEFAPHQLARMRDQTPNPEHVKALEDARSTPLGMGCDR